jgi:5'(3')-deoxyribonucleotidase
MKIIIDVDDVLADTFGAFEDLFGIAADASVENLDLMFPGADIKSVLESVDFHLKIPPLDGAAVGVKWLIESGHDVMYLSSRSPAMEDATEKWLQRYGFPSLPLHCLGRESKKDVLRTNQYDLLIDDQVRYLSIARERGKRTIALANPWNTSWDGMRVEDWNEFKKII